MKKLLTVVVMVFGATLFAHAEMMAPDGAPFGDKESVAFAKKLWTGLKRNKLAGKTVMGTRPYAGGPPHGMILDLIEKEITVSGEKGMAIVKKNYGGDGLTVEDVINDPQRYLAAVTVMFKRHDGYDPEGHDWFYAKYLPDGTLDTNPKGIPLAGRVAKGADTGCIACHKAAPGDDFVFNHDRFANN